MNIYKLKIIYFILWGLGALISFVLQFFFPVILTQGVVWDLSIGWQREIALWNFGIITAIVIVIFKKNSETAKSFVFLLSTLSLLLGVNHMIVVLGNFQKWVHWVGSVANLTAFVFGSILLLIENKINHSRKVSFDS